MFKSFATVYYVGLKEVYDLYLELIPYQTDVDSISCYNPISWFVPLLFLAVSPVLFDHVLDFVFARMFVVSHCASFEFRRALLLC